MLESEITIETEISGETEITQIMLKIASKIELCWKIEIT